MTEKMCSANCDHGWIKVGPAYVAERIAKLPETASDEEIAARSDALERSYMPCAVHRPEQHARWRTGHFELGHNEADCEDCQNNRPRNRRRAR